MGRAMSVSISCRLATPLTLAALVLGAAPLLGCSSDSPESNPKADGSGGSGGGGMGGSGGGMRGSGGGGGGVPAGPIGGDRPVEVIVPSSYQAGTPMPLVILLHGISVSGILQNAYFRLQPLAESRGFLYAYPDGTVNPEGDRFWNATDACCDFEPSGVDDAGYLRRLVDEIKARYTVDPKRVFFVGHSNGGFMAHRMACDHADTIAAIVSLAGAQYSDLSRCTPASPVAVLQVHGTADNTVAYEGGQIGRRDYPGAVATAEGWAELDRCTAAPVAGAPLDLDVTLAGEETTVQIYGDCAPGGHVELWTMEGGRHTPGLTRSFSTAIIDFLFAHPKP
jgi:polyhydroxybutyrate depolymerase